jgi:predicted Zn-dependent protease
MEPSTLLSVQWPLVVLILTLLTATPAHSVQKQGRQPPRNLDPKQAERLNRVMVPLIRAMNHPHSLEEVRVGIVDDPEINAANAGNGVFYVTTGLLQKANDNNLRGVLAHEIAHDDLGHVSKAQILGTGLGLGVVLLEQLIPGSRAIAPIAGTLVARGYSRSEEYQADAHGVEILERAGYSKAVMINALTWIEQTSKDGGGGFLSTHPATADRIKALRKSK